MVNIDVSVIFNLPYFPRVSFLYNERFIPFIFHFLKRQRSVPPTKIFQERKSLFEISLFHRLYPALTTLWSHKLVR